MRTTNITLVRAGREDEHAARIGAGSSGGEPERRGQSCRRPGRVQPEQIGTVGVAGGGDRGGADRQQAQFGSPVYMSHLRSWLLDLTGIHGIKVEEDGFRPQHQAAAYRPAGEVTVLVQSAAPPFFSVQAELLNRSSCEPTRLATTTFSSKTRGGSRPSVGLWLPPRPIAVGTGKVGRRQRLSSIDEGDETMTSVHRTDLLVVPDREGRSRDVSKKKVGTACTQLLPRLACTQRKK
jgi:hypothetical protein